MFNLKKILSLLILMLKLPISPLQRFRYYKLSIRDSSVGVLIALFEGSSF